MENSFFIFIFSGIFLYFLLKIWRNPEEISSPIILILAFVGFSIFFIFFNSFFNEYGLYTGEGPIDMTVTGQVGDFFGGVFGPLLTGVSIVYVYKTFTDQKDFINTQSNYFIRSENDQKHQLFENTFFQLLNTHISLKKEIRIDTLGNCSVNVFEKKCIISGQECFDFAKNEIERLYFDKEQSQNCLKAEGNNGLYESEFDQPLYRIRETYNKFLNTYYHCIGHYFRNFYCLLKYIDQHLEKELMLEFDNQDLILVRFQNYINIIESNLSSSELFLLFYYGLCFPNMEKLIIKYRIVENLLIEDLVDPINHQNLYDNIILKRRYISFAN